MISYLSGSTYKVQFHTPYVLPLVERMGCEITPSTYNLTCWGRIQSRLLYPNTYIQKEGTSHQWFLHICAALHQI